MKRDQIIFGSSSCFLVSPVVPMWLHSWAVGNWATAIKLLHTHGHLPNCYINDAPYLLPVSAWTGTQCFLSDIFLPAQLELSALTAIRSYTVQCVWSALSLPCDKQRGQLWPSARLGFPVFPGTLQMLSCWISYTGKCTFFEVCAFACLSLSVQKQHHVSSNGKWEQSQISDSLKIYFRIPQQPSDGGSF